MNADERAALAIVAVLLASVSGSAGFLGGRMSVEPPPPEVKLVRLPPRVVRVPVAEVPPPEPAIEHPAPAPVDPSPAPAPPLSLPPASVETKPPPAPKVQAKPKPAPAKPKPEKEIVVRKPRPPAPAKKGLPSCAVIKREYETMTYAQQMAAYYRATPEEVAHGKRCLGF